MFMFNFLLILAYLAIGYALKKQSQCPRETPQVLNFLVLYVALPAVVLQKIPQLELSSRLLIPALVPWVLLLCTVLLVLCVARYRRWGMELTAAMLIVLPLGNTSFLGFPMIQAFWGEQWLPYAMIYDQAGSFVALATYSTILAAVYRAKLDHTQGANHELATTHPARAGNGVSARHIVAKIISFPPFIALIVAVVLSPWGYPVLVHNLIDSLAVLLVPLIMIAVGFNLDFSQTLQHRGALVLALGYKLLLMPLIALLLCLGLNLPLSDKAVQVSIIEAAMPPMISAGAIAISAGLAPRFVTALIGIGLLCSFISLPLWFWGLGLLSGG
jgi:predicted permease